MGNSDKELSPNYQSNNFKSWNANFWYGSHGLLEKRKCPSMAIHYSSADVTRNVNDSEAVSNVVDSFLCRVFQHLEVRDAFIRQKGCGKGLYLLTVSTCLLVFILYFETELAVNSLIIFTHSQA